jgi:hypothetical protein
MNVGFDYDMAIPIDLSTFPYQTFIEIKLTSILDGSVVYGEFGGYFTANETNQRLLFNN